MHGGGVSARNLSRLGWVRGESCRGLSSQVKKPKGLCCNKGRYHYFRCRATGFTNVICLRKLGFRHVGAHARCEIVSICKQICALFEENFFGWRILSGHTEREFQLRMFASYRSLELALLFSIYTNKQFKALKSLDMYS